MNIIFFEESRENFLTIAFTRPIAEIRIGILTIKEKWEKLMPEASFSYLTEDYLSTKYPLTSADDNVFVNSSVCPNSELIDSIKELSKQEQLFVNDRLVAVKCSVDDFKNEAFQSSNKKEFHNDDLIILDKIHDVFGKNGEAIRQDYDLLTENRVSKRLSESNLIIGDQLFVEEGAKIEGVTINCAEGPVYIGKDVEIMEGTVIRGPLAMCDNSTLKLGTKIYGPTTVGPFSKIGGEVNNSVIIGYSNKGHDGFLGNSIIGEWCNLGADTNTSNLKNNYAKN